MDAPVKQQADINRLTLEQLITIIRKQGFPDYTEEIFRADVENGAPQNEDGTVNLFDYGAWLFTQRYRSNK